MTHNERKERTEKKMKKFNLAKVLSLVFVCVMLVGCLALTAFATTDPVVEIKAANVFYGETYQVMLAVNAPDGAVVTAKDSEGNDIEVVVFEENPTKVINGVECKVYILTEGVAPQAINEVITLAVEYNGTTVTKNYSVFQYIYERLYVNNIAEGAEREMFNALLDYANKANVYFYEDNSMTTSTLLAVKNMAIGGVDPTGMYKAGELSLAEIVCTLDYDSTLQTVVYNVSLDGADAVEMTLDEVKAIVVENYEAITIVPVLNDHEHSYSEKVTAPTCTEAGYTTYTCACGDSYKGNNVDATGIHLDEDGDYVCDYDSCSELILPADGTVLTVAEAIKIGSLFKNATGPSYAEYKYHIVGRITSLSNTIYGTCQITDETGTIDVYGLKDSTGTNRYEYLETKPIVGDTVKIYGKLGAYYQSVQFDNSNIIEHTVHTCSEYTDATCKDLAECIVCGKTTGTLAGHNYVEGICSVCGHVEGTAEVVTMTATLKYSTASTTNMTGNNDAAKLGLDETIFSVVGNKGGTSNNCGLNKSGQIRLYANKSDGNGSYFTVTIAEGYEIKSIKITFTNTNYNKNCQLTVDGTNTVFDGTSTTWEMDINSDSFMLKNVITGTNTQIYIASIEITYVAE